MQVHRRLDERTRRRMRRRRRRLTTSRRRRRSETVTEEIFQIDDIVEENAHSYYDETWKMDIIDFSEEAIFKQKINISDSTKFTLKGNVNFMVCKDGSCLPPEDYKFEIVVNE